MTWINITLVRLFFLLSARRKHSKENSLNLSNKLVSDINFQTICLQPVLLWPINRHNFAFSHTDLFAEKIHDHRSPYFINRASLQCSYDGVIFSVQQRKRELHKQFNTKRNPAVYDESNRNENWRVVSLNVLDFFFCDILEPCVWTWLNILTNVNTLVDAGSDE